MFFGDKKLGILFSGRSEILNPFPAMFLGGSEILNLLLCSLGDQKLWILFCAFVGDQKFSHPFVCLCRGSEILNPFVCHCWGSEILSLWGFRNTESFVVFFGDKKFWILSFVVWGIRNSIFFPALLGPGSEILSLATRNSKNHLVFYTFLNHYTAVQIKNRTLFGRIPCKQGNFSGEF